MSDKDPLSEPISFRLALPVYNQMAIVVSQQMDPRVKRNSDACKLGIELWLESVGNYTQRPEVQKFNYMRRAIREAHFRRDAIAMQKELDELSWAVGNGQLDKALTAGEERAKLFIPGE